MHVPSLLPQLMNQFHHPLFSLCCCHSNCASFFCIHRNPSSSPWMQRKEGIFLIISLDQLLFCHSLHPFMYHILQFVYAGKQNRDALTHYCLKRFTRQILRSSIRQALIVYRLIDAALIGIFFMIPLFET